MRHSQERNQLTSALYISEDGGRSWYLSLEDSSSRFGGVWDPACTFGLDNQMIFVTLIRPDNVQFDTESIRYDVAPRKEELGNRAEIEIRTGAFNTTVGGIAQGFSAKGEQLAPAFVMIEPLGY